MHETVIIETQGYQRTLAEKVVLVEVVVEQKQDKCGNRGEPKAQELEYIRNEAAQELSRLRAVTSGHDAGLSDAERKISAVIERQTSPVTRHVSPVVPHRIGMGRTPSPPVRHYHDVNGRVSAPTRAVLASPAAGRADAKASAGGRLAAKTAAPACSL